MPPEAAHDAPFQVAWRRELPDREGDWLWVIVSSCGCCVINCGIAYVYDYAGATDKERAERLKTATALQDTLLLSFESHNSPPAVDDVTAWAQVELPPKEWSEI